jgi:hypothetical protein
MQVQPVTSGSRNDEGIQLSLVVGEPLSIRSLVVFGQSLERMEGLNTSSNRLLAISISNSRLVGKFILSLSKDVDAQCFSTCGEKRIAWEVGSEPTKGRDGESGRSGQRAAVDGSGRSHR